MRRTRSFLFVFFDYADALVEDIFEKDRHLLDLGDWWCRFFEVAHWRRSAIDKMLYESSLDDTKDKEGSCKVLNSFFRTEERLL